MICRWPDRLKTILKMLAVAIHINSCMHGDVRKCMHGAIHMHACTLLLSCSLWYPVWVWTKYPFWTLELGLWIMQCANAGLPASKLCSTAVLEASERDAREDESKSTGVPAGRRLLLASSVPFRFLVVYSHSPKPICVCWASGIQDQGMG
jgi:hypothetical protein